MTEQSNILNEVKNFYVNLYIKNIEQGCNSTNFSNGPQKTCKQGEILPVSHKKRELCQKDITGEIQKAVLTFENNKSQGIDGLMGEFYKTFLEILVKDLQELYTEISEIGRMPDSIQQAVITCIYKKRDMEDITNW